MSSSFVRRYLPISILNVFMIVLIINFFTGELAPIATEMKSWGVLVGYMAMFYGTFFLGWAFIRAIRRRTPGDWGPNLWGMIVMIIVIVVGTADNFDVVGKNIGWINNNLNIPLGVSMYVASCFVLFAAIYHRFIATSWEAVVFMLATIGQMFTNAPVFGYLWPGFDTISATLTTLSSFGQSTLLMAAVFGMVAVGIRTFTGRGGAATGVLEQATE